MTSDPIGYVPRRSFSPITVLQIRYAMPLSHESNACVRKRLQRTYDLDDTEVRLLIGADEDHIDGFGRIAE